MASLTQDRKTVRLNPEDSVFPLVLSFPVAASTSIKGGAMVMVKDGYGIPAQDGYGLSFTTLKTMGRCERAVDNSSGAAGAIRVEVRPGAYLFDNDTVAAVALTHVGAKCYVKDDHTVSSSANGGDTSSRKEAGTVLGLDANGQVMVMINMLA